MITRDLLDVVEPTTDRLPAVDFEHPSGHPSEWTRDEMLDAAAVARLDSWALSGHRDLIEAICADYVQIDSEHRQDADRIAELERANAELERKLARERESHRVTTILQIAGLAEGLRLTKQLTSLSEQLAVQGRAMARITTAYHQLRTGQLRVEAAGRRPAKVFDVTDTGTCHAAVEGADR